MTTPESTHSQQSFDLGGLVVRLREAGFRTDTRQYLTAHRLILAMAEQGARLDHVSDYGDAERVASCLAPVFCHSPEEQNRFRDIVTLWLGVSEPRRSRRRMEVLKTQREKLRKVAVRPVRAFVGMTLLVLAGTILFYYFVPVTITVQVLRHDAASRTQKAAVDATVYLEDAPVTMDSGGRFSFELTRFASPERVQVQQDGYQKVDQLIDARMNTAVRIVLQPIQAPSTPVAVNGIWIGEPQIISFAGENSTRIRRTRWPLAGGIPAVLCIGIFLSLVLAGHVRRKLVIKRLPATQRTDLTTLAIPDAPSLALAGPRLRRLVGAMRRPRKEDLFELSALLTARATARAGGMFSPVWEPRRRMPEYVVLIDRKSSQDHLALMFDDFLKGLEQSDVAITRYYFQDDPRVCRRADDPSRQWLLNELAVIHHACSLFVCADTDLLFDPLTGAPAHWTAKFGQWSRRVLFTPRPPYHWSRQEWALAAEGMVVLPATVSGIQLFADLPAQWRIESLFPATYARAFPSILGNQGLRWLDRNPPPDDIAAKLLRQLQGYLGPSGFTWLCACAVYPEINWSLTRYLSRALEGHTRDTGGSAFWEPLQAMVRLPWFRYGYMPDWLRMVLLGQLSVDQEKKVRSLLDRLLDQMARQIPKTDNAGGLQAATWITPRDLISTSPGDDPLSDTVFVGFICGARVDRLDVQAPSSFKNVFRRSGRFLQPDIPGPRRSFGHRVGAWIRELGIWHKTLLRIAVSVLAGVLALALTIPLFTDIQERKVDTIAHDVAFNPKGDRIAVGSWDNSIGLWDLVSRTPVGSFQGHTDFITRICFSPDGKTLASGSWDRTVRLWDVASGQQIVVFKGHTAKVFSVAFSPDGKLLASGSEDATVRLWDLATKRQAVVLTGHGDFVSSVAFSPDGRTLASGSGDRTIRLWDIGSGRSRMVLEGHDAYVSSVAFSPAGDLLASGSGDRTVRIWNARSGRQLHVLLGHQDYVSTVVFNPGGGILASSGSKDKTIRLWDTATGKSLRVLADFAQMPVLCVAFNTRGSSLAAGEWGKIFIWPVTVQPRQIQIFNQGYCCAPDNPKSDRPAGMVFQSDATACRKKGGTYFSNEKEAEVICTKKYGPLKPLAPSAPMSITVQ